MVMLDKRVSILLKFKQDPRLFNIDALSLENHTYLNTFNQI